MFVAIQRLTRILAQKGIRVTFEPFKKFLIASVFEDSPKVQKYFSFVSPKTILAKWKNAASRYWPHPHKNKGWPPLSKTVKQLILKLKKENPLWGCRRIRDELLKLSITVSHETISRVLHLFRKTGDIQPSLSWKKFLSSHWKSIFACDFLTATVFGMVAYYVFFIMELKTRKIIQASVASHPGIQFLKHQFSVFEYEHPGAALIHDNSGELRCFPYNRYNFKEIRIVPYSPNMNAYAERFVRSMRQECLDHFIIFSYGQLQRLVSGYIEYYNNYRDPIKG